jgi:hypothetical protein
LRKLTKTQREATAYHEAGHSVVAWHLDVRVLNISIVPDEDSVGRAQHAKLIRGRHPELLDSPRVRVAMEKQLMISLAGMTAQRQFKPRSVRSYHGSKDFREVADIALHLNAISDDAATAFIKFLEIKTRDVIRLRWPWVKVLVKELLGRNTIKGKEVTQLLNTYVPPKWRAISP